MRYMFGGKAKIPMTIRTCHGAGASAAAQHYLVHTMACLVQFLV